MLTHLKFTVSGADQTQIEEEAKLRLKKLVENPDQWWMSIEAHTNEHHEELMGHADCRRKRKRHHDDDWDW